MSHPFPVPRRPESSQPQAPLIYVHEPLRWAYKQVVRSLDEEGALSLEALNRLGADGWELADVLVHAVQATYIFKRMMG